MTEYIDREKVQSIIIGQFPEAHYPSWYAEQIREIPAEDVVPRSEFETLEKKYELAVAEREANVKGFTETLEQQRAEIERLQAVNETLETYEKHYKYRATEAQKLNDFLGALNELTI